MAEREARAGVRGRVHMTLLAVLLLVAACHAQPPRFAPPIVRSVSLADSATNAQPGWSDGDTLTFTFDRATDRAGFEQGAALSANDLNAMFPGLSGYLGTSFDAKWLSDSVLRVTALNASGASSIFSTGVQTFQLGAPSAGFQGIKAATNPVSAAASGSTPALSGAVSSPADLLVAYPNATLLPYDTRTFVWTANALTAPVDVRVAVPTGAGGVNVNGSIRLTPFSANESDFYLPPSIGRTCFHVSPAPTLVSFSEYLACILAGPRPASASAPRLTALAVFIGTDVLALSPTFSAETMAYTVQAEGDVREVRLRATPLFELDTVEYAVGESEATAVYQLLRADSASDALPLTLNGATSMWVRVTSAVDPELHVVYALRVFNFFAATTLSALSAMSTTGSLEPAFSQFVLNYTVSIAFTGSVVLKAVPTAGTASINVTVPPSAPVAYTPDDPINFADVPEAPAALTVTFHVRDASANMVDYAVRVSRRAAETDASLALLTVTASTATIADQPVGITPLFSPAQRHYVISFLPERLTNLQNLVFRVRANSTLASITIGGQSAAPETPFLVSPVVPGNISVVVTAESGAVATYTVRVLEEDATLSAFDVYVAEEPLPGRRIGIDNFMPAQLQYELNVSYNRVRVRPTANSALHSSIVVGSTPVNSSSPFVEFNVGTAVPTIFSVNVFAENNIVAQLYSFRLYRLSPEARLGALIISTRNSSGGSFDNLPFVFNSDIFEYELQTPVGSTEVLVFAQALAPPVANATFNGFVQNLATPSIFSISVEAPLTVNITIVALDGIASASYHLRIIRPASNSSELASLFVLQYLPPDNTQIVAASLMPAFQANSIETLEYAAEIYANVTQVGFFAQASSTLKRNVTVNGVAFAPVANPQPLVFTVPIRNTSFNVTVFPESGIPAAVYRVTVMRTPNRNARLRQLILLNATDLQSLNSLPFSFQPQVLSYQVNVSNTLLAVGIVGFPEDDLVKSVSIGGLPFNFSSPMPRIFNLTLRSNMLNVSVVAQDEETVNVYTIDVFRVPSTQSALQALILLNATGGVYSSISYGFSSAQLSYNVSLPSSLVDVALVAMPIDATVSSMTANGFNLTSMQPRNFSLALRNNFFTVVSVAQDGETNTTYSLVLFRTPETISTLQGMSLTGIRDDTTEENVTPSPFSPSQLVYSRNVSQDIRRVRVLAGPTSNVATMLLNGQQLLIGSPVTLNLTLRANLLNITVVAQDGETVSQYLVTLFRVPNSDSALVSLGLYLDNALLGPSPFSLATLQYNITVSPVVRFAEVRAQPRDSSNYLNLSVNGTLFQPAAPLNVSISLVFTRLLVRVFAQDGETSTLYELLVTRTPDSNSALAELGVALWPLSPAFDPGVTSYLISVGGDVASVQLFATPASPTYDSLQLNGTAIVPVQLTAPVALALGPNLFAIRVVAEDKVSNTTYLISATRVPFADSRLSALSVSAGGVSLGPLAFNSDVFSYEIDVLFNLAAVNVTASPRDSLYFSSLTINGESASAGVATLVPILSNDTILSVNAVAQDGVSVSNYTVRIRRLLLADATLSSLQLQGQSISPAFSPAITSYTASVPGDVASVRVIAAFNATYVSSFTANNIPLTPLVPSTPLALNLGPNVIAVRVAAENATVALEYAIVVTRVPSSEARLASLRVAGDAVELQPLPFNPNMTTLNASVVWETAQVAFVASPMQAFATMTLNGSALVSNVTSANLSLVVGVNEFTVTVTAQDAQTQFAYRIFITRRPRTTVDVTALSVADVALQPAVFDQAHGVYTGSVNRSQAFVSVRVEADATALNLSIADAAVALGAARNVSLALCANNVSVVVFAQDGVFRRSYSLLLDRSPAPVDLEALAVLTPGATLFPPFSPTTANYSVVVPKGQTVARINVTARGAGSDPEVSSLWTLSPAAAQRASGQPFDVPTVADPASDSGYVLQLRPPNCDASNWAEYRLFVSVFRSPVAELASLDFDDALLSPPFSPATLAYTATRCNVSALRVRVRRRDPFSTVRVNGVEIPQVAGGAGEVVQVSLAAGNVTTLRVLVEAENGQNATEYVVTHTACETGLATTLLKLSVETPGVQLSPPFSPLTFGYQTEVNFSVTYLEFAPLPLTANASLLVGGVTRPADRPFNVSLALGWNSLRLVVIDAAGARTYVVNVLRRAPPENASPTAVAVVDGVQIPLPAANSSGGGGGSGGGADPGLMQLNVTGNTATVRVFFDGLLNGTVVTANGQQLALQFNASGSAFVDAPIGANGSELAMEVVAPDRVSTSRISLRVLRTSASSLLRGLNTAGVPLSSNFSAALREYSTLQPISHAVSEVVVFAVPMDAQARLSFVPPPVRLVPTDSGETGYGLPVQREGMNEFVITVTSSDSSSSQSYALRVERLRQPCSHLSFCFGNGRCVGQPPNDTCACQTNYFGADCSEIESSVTYTVETTTTVTLVFAGSTMAGSAVASSTGSSSLPMSSIWPVIFYIQSFVLPLAHNADMESVARLFRSFNLVQLNGFNTHAGSLDNPNPFLYSHGLGRKCVMLIFGIVLFALLPGRTLVNCCGEIKFEPQMVFPILMFFLMPLAESIYELPAQPQWVMLVELAAFWAALAAFVLLVVRPQLTEERLLHLMPGQGWSGVRFGRSFLEESIVQTLRHKYQKFKSSNSITFLQDLRLRLMLVDSKRWAETKQREEEARKRREADEAAAREALLQAQHAEPSRSSSAALAASADAPAAAAAAPASESSVVVEMAAPAAAAPTRNGDGKHGDGEHGDAKPGGNPDKYKGLPDISKFKYKFFFEKTTRYTPWTRAESAGKTYWELGLHALRCRVSVYYAFFDIAFTLAYVLAAVRLDGELQFIVLILGLVAQAIATLIIFPYQTASVFQNALTQLILAAQLSIFLAVLRDRQLILPLGAVAMIMCICLLVVRNLIAWLFGQGLEADDRKKWAYEETLRRREAAKAAAAGLPASAAAPPAAAAATAASAAAAGPDAVAAERPAAARDAGLAPAPEKDESSALLAADAAARRTISDSPAASDAVAVESAPPVAAAAAAAPVPEPEQPAADAQGAPAAAARVSPHEPTLEMRVSSMDSLPPSASAEPLLAPAPEH